MNSVFVAASIMGGLGLALATVLSIAYRFLRVEEDPRIDGVEERLPGSNCGACSEPGCRAFAERLVADDAVPAQCTVSSPEAIDAVAAYLGVDAGEAQRRVARLHCAGGSGQAIRAAEYAGFGSCRAATLVSGGGKGCSWGCLGLADCELACSFGAIEMTVEALPRVDPTTCTACGDCVEACPKNLFELLPLEAGLLVQCAAPLAGDEAVAVCTVACDACGRCALDAPAGLVEMVQQLAWVDYGSGVTGGEEATSRCPTGAIQFLSGGQFEGLARRRDAV